MYEHTVQKIFANNYVQNRGVILHEFKKSCEPYDSCQVLFWNNISQIWILILAGSVTKYHWINETNTVKH